jgi:hypothetical protein
MRHVLLLCLGLSSAACAHPSAFIVSPVALAPALVGSWRLESGGVRSTGFYDPETLEFADSKPGQYITLTAEGGFESGRVTRAGVGACAVTRYEYHRGTVEVRDSVLVLYATAGRVRNVAPCDLTSDYEKNDTGVESLAIRSLDSLVREAPSVVADAR